MYDFKQPEYPVLDAIEKIYTLVKESSLKAETLSVAETELGILTHFFECTEEQAIILSVLILSKLTEGNCSIKDLLTHMSLKTSHALYFNELLHPFTAKGWLSPVKNVNLYPLTEYSIHSKLMRSVLTGKLEVWETSRIETSYDLLIHFQKKIKNKKNEFIGYQEFIEITNSLIYEYKNIELADFIIQMQMKPEDTLLFMIICLQYYSGRDSVDFEAIITDLDAPKQELYKLRNSYKNGTHFLFTAGLLKENISNNIFEGVSILLTEKAIHAFDRNAVIKNKLPDGMLKHIEPISISEKKLIFDNKEQQLVNKLHTMISTKNFNQLTKRLEGQGMKGGISVLLYGHPGTGKTETVLQIGKTSNRYIMQADASKIRSKWVGETAKNIKELFDEYRKARMDFEETPILLFNEADAIIGKRHHVGDRGDQEMNTMQNILLEELENFEGIFIATTNLVDNIDKAFDRRFLYKIRFEKPGAETVAQIWKSKFPKVKMSVLKNICAKINLSGGQIENIRKKVMVDSLIEEKFKLTEAYLLELAEQELLLEKKTSSRTPIGFVI